MRRRFDIMGLLGLAVLMLDGSIPRKKLFKGFHDVGH